VDDKGYVLSDGFVTFASNWFTKEQLKAVVKRVTPGCVTEANAHAKGKYKPNSFGCNHSVRNYLINYF
jgi:hypothetical protein